jgi:hypothetical protein
MAEETAGERLRRFLGEGPDARMSVRAFAARMQEREPRPKGSTRAMIHRYLSGAQPPADFLEAAADQLGLNPEWLAFGRGEPTTTDATVAEEGRRTVGDAVWEHFVEGAGFTPPDTLRHVAFLLWRRRASAFEKDGGLPVGHFDPARQVGVALFAPLRALGLNPALFHPQQVEAYALAAMPAVAAAADYIHEPKPEEV